MIQVISEATEQILTKFLGLVDPWKHGKAWYIVHSSLWRRWHGNQLLRWKCLCTTGGNVNRRNWVSSVMLYTENDTASACYCLNTHQSIFTIFGRDVAEYAIKWCFAISPLLTNVSALPGETWTLEIGSFQLLYTVSRKRHCFSLIYFQHSSTNLNSFCRQ